MISGFDDEFDETQPIFWHIISSIGLTLSGQKNKTNEILASKHHTASFRSSTFYCFTCLKVIFNDKLHRVCTNVKDSADYCVRVAAAYSLADSSFSLIFARHTHIWSESFFFCCKKRSFVWRSIRDNCCCFCCCCCCCCRHSLKYAFWKKNCTVYTESSQEMCIDIWAWWTGERRSNNCAHRWLNVCTTHTCFYYIILSHSQCE